MVDTPENLRVGAAGKGYVAPLGTVAPVAIETYVAGPPEVYTPVVWAAAWKDLGLISEEGLSEGVDEDRSEWKPWGYQQAVRTQIKKSETTFKLTCWETNAETLSLWHRTPKSEMTQYSPKEIHFATKQRTKPDLRAFGFDVLDGDSHFRYIVARGEVTDRGELKNSEDEVIAYEFTITAYPGADGISVQRYVKAGIALA